VTYRTARGLSREAAARMLVVAQGTLWRWESGRRTPGRVLLPRDTLKLVVEEVNRKFEEVERERRRREGAEQARLREH
jgi:transcriptional regulator with XRE-family HTH domain